MSNQYKLVEKAWGINWPEIDGGLYHAGNINNVYADTRGKAKSLLLPDIRDYRLRYSDEEIVFTNIPVKRIKEADRYNFDGNILTMRDHEENEFERKRISELESIQVNENITHCYIKKGPYYGDNWCGYTDFKHRAGVYNKTEAVQAAKSCRDITIIPINCEDHNQMIHTEINTLQSKLIN